MNSNNLNPDSEKAREYQEIQERATRNGYLEGVDTHITTDAAEVMNHRRNVPHMGIRDNSTPGLGRGVEGTGVMENTQKNSTSATPEFYQEDCGCGDIDQKTIDDAMEEVGD